MFEFEFSDFWLERWRLSSSSSSSSSLTVGTSSCSQTSGRHLRTQGPGEGVHPVPQPPHARPAPPAVCRHRRYTCDTHTSIFYTWCTSTPLTLLSVCLSVCRQCLSRGDGGTVGPNWPVWLGSVRLSDLQTEPDIGLWGSDLQVNLPFFFYDFLFLYTFLLIINLFQINIHY